jgi:predicted O-linked N-acetylglucosamine transferase (SPINDLY family)
MPDVANALADAEQLLASGRVQECETRCREIVAGNGSNHDAWYLLGAVCAAQDRLQEAVACYHEVLRLYPDHAAAHRDLGAVAAMHGRWQEAIHHCRRALALAPGAAPTYNNLGAALINVGAAVDAQPCLEQAVLLDPGNVDAHNNLGVALKSLGKTAEAVSHFRRAIELAPQHSRAHYNLGNALHQQGNLGDATAAYLRALALEQDFVDCLNNLGVVLTAQGKLEEAELFLNRALTLDPEHAGAHSNLGNLLRAKNRLEDAVRAYQHALLLQPEHPDPQNNLGVVLTALGRVDEAVACYQHAVNSRPDFAAAHSNLLACWNYLPDIDLDALFAEHCNWAKQHAVATPTIHHDGNRDLERPLRIGYVSPDFRRHPVADFLRPIFTHHDRRAFEVFAYAEVVVPDAVTAFFQTKADGWRSTHGLSDTQICEQVRADKIDILVDLAGHTANSRLRAFAFKPAPVQITYLGYPSTTGLSTIDYRLTDALADPPGEPRRYTEELVRLPRAFCYAPPEDAPRVGPLPALRKGHITFGSLHNLAKLNGRVLDLWCEVLRRLPRSRMLVFRDALEDATKKHFQTQFTMRGIRPDRLEFRQTVDGGATHLPAYQAVDLSLDPFPWNGHTTACESLWMGVPVIALYGDHYAGRMAADTLTAAGLTELIAHSLEQYLDIAADWAADLNRLAKVRVGLRDRMRDSPLCDGRGFTRNLEAVYRELWRRSCG